jgi:hypothetical protein
MKTDDIAETGQQIIDDIVRLKDQGRVRWHLLGMEVRDRWEQLEKQADEAVRSARELTESTLERARSLREKLRSELGIHSKSGET